MAAQSFSGFSSFIEVNLANTNIPFISSWSATQTRGSSQLVYTISNSATAAGAAEQQIGWEVSLDIPLSVIEEFFVDINDIAIGDGTQIRITLNRPSANNDQLDFTGTTFLFSDLAPNQNTLGLREGGVATQNFSFYAGKMNTSSGA